MRWTSAAFLFFGYAALLAVIVSGLMARQRWVCAAASAAGSLVTATVAFYVPPVWWRDWIAPAAVLLLSYWGSGALFRAPMATAEAALRRFDCDLEVRHWARRTPSWLIEVLEAAYAGVYVIIPLALVLHLALSASPDPSRFWTAVLVTDFICFGVLPWLQTRTPRAL